VQSAVLRWRWPQNARGPLSAKSDERFFLPLFFFPLFSSLCLLLFLFLVAGFPLRKTRCGKPAAENPLRKTRCGKPAAVTVGGVGDYNLLNE
jgi:hypothetical protein